MKEPAWNMANHVYNLHFFDMVFTNTVTTIVAAIAVEKKYVFPDNWKEC